MPRYYRRRYTRVVKPKKKWASNIKKWVSKDFSSPFVVDLAENAIQTLTPTPSILKVGNFKVSLDCYFPANTSGLRNVVVQVFILFVPEGFMDVQVPEIPGKHPEWIMASKSVGGDFQTGINYSLETLNMSTRLKRNLNSGDRVVLYFDVSTEDLSSLFVTGHVRYWTCSN